jgi:hypothetical protein
MTLLKTKTSHHSSLQEQLRDCPDTNLTVAELASVAKGNAMQHNKSYELWCSVETLARNFKKHSATSQNQLEACLLLLKTTQDKTVFTAGLVWLDEFASAASASSGDHAWGNLSIALLLAGI